MSSESQHGSQNPSVPSGERKYHETRVSQIDLFDTRAIVLDHLACGHWALAGLAPLPEKQVQWCIAPDGSGDLLIRWE